MTLRKNNLSQRDAKNIREIRGRHTGYFLDKEFCLPEKMKGRKSL